MASWGHRVRLSNCVPAASTLREVVRCETAWGVWCLVRGFRLHSSALSSQTHETERADAAQSGR
eukprot:scaffold36343_cov60-Phaeocystis_antarctica.AAC.3